MRLFSLLPKVIFLFLCMIVANTSYAAEDFIMRFKKPMPEIEKMPERDFLDLTTVYEQIPFGQKAFAHTVRVPKEWTKEDEKGTSNFQISDKLLTKIAIFYGEPTINGQERFEIKTTMMSFDMDAEEWFLQYLMASGNTTEGYIYHDKYRVEALMLVMEGDISYVKRTVAQINGRHVFLVEYLVPVDMWDQRAGLQERVVQSFKIINPVVESVVKKIPYQILDIARINYPDFWENKPDSLTSVERLGVKFFNFLDQSNEEDERKKAKPIIMGRIDVLLVASWSSPSLLEEVETFKKQTEANNMLIGDKIANIETFKYFKTVSFGQTESYKVLNNTDNSKEYEFWLTVLVSGNYYYFISLMTPSRNDDYATWVRNTQSYKIVIENTEPAEKIRDL